MRFIALATDYDETLADQGVVPDAVLSALRRFKGTGRRLILVTGRELPDIQSIFRSLDLFDRVVAENGAVLFNPAAKVQRDLGLPPSAALIKRLTQDRVTPLSIGRSIIATRQPHEATVLKAIRDLDLELEIIFNKDALMVLPPSVNKATGLAAALEELGISAHEVVGIGDAENDYAFLNICGCAAAVSNALPAIREKAHVVMRAARGAGVIELIHRIDLEDDSLTFTAIDTT